MTKVEFSGGTTIENLSPVELLVIYHGCMNVERMAQKGSNMEKAARELREKLRPVVESL